MLEIEHEVVEEFKAHMSNLGREEERMMQRFQESGRVLDAEATDEIRSRLVEMMTTLNEVNAIACERGKSGNQKGLSAFIYPYFSPERLASEEAALPCTQ